MQTRSGADIVFDGDVVHKLHRIGTNPRYLAQRLRIAREPPALLSPLSVVPEAVGPRWRSSWPRVDTVAPDPEHAPWVEAGALLAALHTEPVTARAPGHGWPQRLRRTVERLRSERGPIHAAAVALPAVVWRTGTPGRPVTLVHGDWHLGQLGRRGPAAAWQLIDVDDVGVGDPAWDLARPAGFWAAGLIPDVDWQTFLEAYRARGPGLPPGDPWRVLEPFARAAVVHAAATGLAHGDTDDTQQALLDACERMR
ncbi:phosphotransferase family protein [Mycolicibacterium austroafricanum]|uniref:phosphotransferase family protein n=1 Tax=Mycolicibacterium austroafricanum TaxID=39687 RepID=UPI000CFA1568|nr:phosphotransferase [Mycolicibacterium austroafricanum]PQP40100.1 aminoglycoside phosphotransferase [Mycolicibacterium austroafricanum]